MADPMQPIAKIRPLALTRRRTQNLLDLPPKCRRI